jgi:cytochrome c
MNVRTAYSNADRHHTASLRSSVGAFVILLLIAVNAPRTASAQTVVERGRVLLETNCARCHAIGTTGTSPLANAPLFRHLNRKYPIETLAEALAEGIVTGHSEMPEFTFSPPEIDAILAFLNSIAEP